MQIDSMVSQQGEAERDEQADEESEATIWRHSEDLDTPEAEEGRESSPTSDLLSLPSPPSIASPATQRKAIDMQKASRMARGTRKRTKSSLSMPVTMPALFPKDDAILARELNLPEDQRILVYVPFDCLYLLPLFAAVIAVIMITLSNHPQKT